MRDFELNTHRDLDPGGLCVRRVHGFGECGFLHCRAAGVGEGHVHGEGRFRLISHDVRIQRQLLGFDRKHQRGNRLRRAHVRYIKTAALIIGQFGINCYGILGHLYYAAIFHCQVIGYVGNLEAAAALAVVGEQQIEVIPRQTILGRELHRVLLASFI